MCADDLESNLTAQTKLCFSCYLFCLCEFQNPRGMPVFEKTLFLPIIGESCSCGFPMVFSVYNTNMFHLYVYLISEVYLLKGGFPSSWALVNENKIQKCKRSFKGSKGPYRLQ